MQLEWKVDGNEIGRAREGATVSIRVHGERDAREPFAEAAARRSAKGLGFLSVALGAAHLAAPAALAGAIGIRKSRRARAALYAVGARGIVNGFGILARPRHPAWVWARVAGDVIDIALLASTLKSRRTDTRRVIAAGAGVALLTVFDVVTAARLRGRDVNAAERRRLHRTKAITVNRPLDEVARAWQRHEGAASGRANGAVRFALAPGDRGTEVHVEHGPAEGRRLATRLRLFKQIVETGEIVRSDASVHRGMHPASPSIDGRKAVFG